MGSCIDSCVESIERKRHVMKKLVLVQKEKCTFKDINVYLQKELYRPFCIRSQQEAVYGKHSNVIGSDQMSEISDRTIAVITTIITIITMAKDNLLSFPLR